MTFRRGDMVLWTFRPLGGYGHKMTIPATVVRMRKSSVVIEITRLNGSKAEVAVAAEELQAAKVAEVTA